MSRGALDYFGVNVGCGCLTAWMSSDNSTKAEVRKFYADMAKTGREVRRMELTDETRSKLMRCSHGESA